MSTSTFTKMLEKYGDNSPQNERAIFSVAVMKINKKEKSQKRILLLTNKALYNLKPTNTRSCQRRISYHIIESISISTISNEFIIHIPTQYDYRYKSDYSAIICKELQKLHHKSTNNSTNLINKIHQHDLGLMVCSKKQSKNMSLNERRERLQFYYSLFNETIHNINTSITNSTISDLNENMFLKTPKTNTITSSKQHSIFGEGYGEIEYENDSGIDEINMHSDGDIIGDINTINYIGECNNELNISISRNYKRSETLRRNFDTLVMNRKYLLIRGFLHKINTCSCDISFNIMDCCLLYLSTDFLECFDKTNNMWSDLVIFKNNNQTISLYNKCNGINVYGTYIIKCNEMSEGNNIYKWQLKINDIGNDGSIWIGIDSIDYMKANYKKCFKYGHNYNSNNYSFGGSKLMGYNLWNKDKIIDNENGIKMLGNGDWIEVILNCNKETLVFVVNCNECYVIQNVEMKDIKYRLAVYISNVSISLKQFNKCQTLS